MLWKKQDVRQTQLSRIMHAAVDAAINLKVPSLSWNVIRFN